MFLCILFQVGPVRDFEPVCFYFRTVSYDRDCSRLRPRLFNIDWPTAVIGREDDHRYVYRKTGNERSSKAGTLRPSQHKRTVEGAAEVLWPSVHLLDLVALTLNHHRPRFEIQ